MKVGILTGSISGHAGGVSESVYGFARELYCPPVIDVALFGLKDSGTTSYSRVWSPIPVATFSVSGPRSFGYARDLLPAIEGADIDLLHVHGLWMYSSIVSSRWKKAPSAPRVISPHGMLDPGALSISSWKKRLAAVLYEGRHLQRGACIHALCDAEAVAIRNYGLDNPICVIPNGVVEAGQNSEKQPPWREKLPEAARTILYLGRLHPKKGLRGLLQAWRDVQLCANAASRNWYLVIAGWDQGGHGAELESLTSSLGVVDTVRFVGPQFGEEKEQSFWAADAVILPSFSEGLPMVVLEAWAHRRPVLMTPQCNLPEGFASGAALAIDHKDGSLARQLQRLFSMSEEEREGMGDEGLRLAQTRFSWSRAGSEMRSVYRWLLGAGPQPGCVRLS
jgi:poly(glycerol-phosphate) alpha-glucosyltransferase